MAQLAYSPQTCTFGSVPKVIKIITAENDFSILTSLILIFDLSTSKL